MLTSHKWDPITFSYSQLQTTCHKYNSLQIIWKLRIRKYFYISTPFVDTLELCISITPTFPCGQLTKCLHKFASAHVIWVSLEAPDPITVLTNAHTRPELLCIATWLWVMHMRHVVYPRVAYTQLTLLLVDSLWPNDANAVKHLAQHWFP